MSVDGLRVVESVFGPAETMDRLEEGVRAMGMTVFARIDHAGGAATVGMELRPTEVLIFGNPKAGTPLMLAAQTIAIDLPLKALVWKDDANVTRVGWNDPVWLAERHGLVGDVAAVAGKMSAALNGLAEKAAGRQ